MTKAKALQRFFTHLHIPYNLQCRLHSHHYTHQNLCVIAHLLTIYVGQARLETLPFCQGWKEWYVSKRASFKSSRRSVGGGFPALCFIHCHIKFYTSIQFSTNILVDHSGDRRSVYFTSSVWKGEGPLSTMSVQPIKRLAGISVWHDSIQQRPITPTPPTPTKFLHMRKSGSCSLSNVAIPAPQGSLVESQLSVHPGKAQILSFNNNS